MKLPLLLLLGVSLAAHAGFALIFVLGSRSAPPAAPAPTVVVAPRPLPPSLTPEIWSALRTDDLPDLVARLRAAGFPPDLVRAVVAAQIGESFAARRRALTSSVERLPFWKEPAPDRKKDVALRQLHREEEKLLRDLLGDAPDTASFTQLNRPGGQLDFLPPAKIEDVRSLLRDFADRRSELYAEDLYEANREKFAALDLAERTAVAGLLTASEFFEYELRHSKTARALRDRLSSFRPSEEEFRTLYPLVRALEDRFDPVDRVVIPTPEQNRLREAADERLKAQIAAALPPERAAEYERTTDHYFRETDRLINRLALPPETTVNLWNLQQEYQRRMIAAGDLPADQRATAFAAIREDLIPRLTPHLVGKLTPELYRQYGGSWTTGFNLTPKP